jgi:hypothetical protein
MLFKEENVEAVSYISRQMPSWDIDMANPRESDDYLADYW